LILAIETSCDDTCAALVADGEVRANVVSSQAAIHERFGGVVPEVASRRHLQLINPVVAAALEQASVRLEDVDSLAVTRGPGLIGALLVGLSTAKALSAAHRKPLAGVNHLHGHVASAFLGPEPLQPPFLCLIASGGHTLLAAVRRGDGFEVLGETLDDAAGEALDKGARLLGLGYPGGPEIQRLGAEGDPEAFDLPHGIGRGGLEFSFSGVKTALLYVVRDLGPEETERRRRDLAASYEAAIVEQLVTALERALDGGDWGALALGGGVAANARLRRRATQVCEGRGIRLKLVEPALCTDNAAMIAGAAAELEPTPYPEYLSWEAVA
jgi:N6-L-threonylcarbamoyladenine synthase